jgi:hypothetical protein
VAPDPPSATKPLVSARALPFHRTRTLAAGAFLAVAAGAGIGFFIWYGRTVIELDRTAKMAGDLRKENVRGIVNSVVARPAPRIGVTAPVEPKVTTDPRKIAPAAATIGDIVVAVQAMRLGKNAESGVVECLFITLRITNLSKKPMAYLTWTAPETGVMLRVQNGSYYNQIEQPKQEARSVNPNETITDTVVFEPPPPPLRPLDLDLPLPGTDQSFQFRIPVSMLERDPVAATASKAMVKAPPEAMVKAPPRPYDPETDPELRTELQREYLAEAREIKRKSLGKPTNDAERFKRIKYRELLKKLAKNHHPDEDQVKRIIGLE